MVKHLLETESFGAVWLQGLHDETLGVRVDLHADRKLYFSISDVDVGLCVIKAFKWWFAAEQRESNDAHCPVVYLIAVAVVLASELYQFGCQVVRRSTYRFSPLSVAAQLG